MCFCAYINNTYLLFYPLLDVFPVPLILKRASLFTPCNTFLSIPPVIYYCLAIGLGRLWLPHSSEQQQHDNSMMGRKPPHPIAWS